MYLEVVARPCNAVIKGDTPLCVQDLHHLLQLLPCC